MQKIRRAMPTCRWILLGVLSVAALLLTAPSALAAVRYAAPGGGGGEPCNPDPCTLANAVNKASNGDQVIVTAGIYKPGSGIDVNHSIDVGAEPGSALPLVQLGPSVYFLVENSSATLHDLRFERVGETMARTLEVATGTVERVYAIEGELSGGACVIVGGLIRDSVCRGSTEFAVGGAGIFHVVLRNDTFGRSLVAASSGANLTVDAANVIMRSEEASQPDLAIDVNVASTGAITLTHSNYATVSTTLSAGTNYSYTQPGTNGNQTAPPQFVDAAAGDYRELPSSPTVDAGLSDPLMGATDLAGGVRSQPTCIGGSPIPDIGAYELTPTAACPTPSNRFGFGKLKRNRSKGTAKLAVKVPGAGTLSLAGAGVVRPKVARTVGAAGTFELLIKAKGKWARKLRRTGKTLLTVKVSFTPTGGEPNTRTKKLKLIKRLRSGAGR